MVLTRIFAYVCLTLILTCLVTYVVEDGYSDIRIYQLMVKILCSISLVLLAQNLKKNCRYRDQNPDANRSSTRFVFLRNHFVKPGTQINSSMEKQNF